MHYVLQLLIGVGRGRHAVTVFECAVIAGIIATTVFIGLSSLADALPFGVMRGQL
jgi:hypothetical protein